MSQWPAIGPNRRPNGMWNCGNSKLWFHWNSRLVGHEWPTETASLAVSIHIDSVDWICVCVWALSEAEKAQINEQQRLLRQWWRIHLVLALSDISLEEVKRNRLAPWFISMHFLLFAFVYSLSFRAERIFQRFGARNLHVHASNSDSSNWLLFLVPIPYVPTTKRGNRIMAFMIWVTYDSIRFCSPFFRSISAQRWNEELSFRAYSNRWHRKRRENRFDIEARHDVPWKYPATWMRWMIFNWQPRRSWYRMKSTN